MSHTKAITHLKHYKVHQNIEARLKISLPNSLDSRWERQDTLGQEWENNVPDFVQIGIGRSGKELIGIQHKECHKDVDSILNTRIGLDNFE